MCAFIPIRLDWRRWFPRNDVCKWHYFLEITSFSTIQMTEFKDSKISKEHNSSAPEFLFIWLLVCVLQRDWKAPQLNIPFCPETYASKLSKKNASSVTIQQHSTTLSDESRMVNRSAVLRNKPVFRKQRFYVTVKWMDSSRWVDRGSLTTTKNFDWWKW